MTSNNEKKSFGLPPPITKLTVEQDLRMRLLEDKLKAEYYEHKDEIITLLLALQKQNFVLGNSLTNLVSQWSIIEEEAMMFGILSGNRI